MAAPLNILERRVGIVTILQVAGRLMLDDGGDRILQDRVAALVAAGRLYLLLDLSRVTSIDSGGVGALASMHIHSVRRGGQFKLLSPSARVERVLRTTHLLQAFDVFHDERAAVESFPSLTTRV
jgi:anti-sigma B factor antagonist